MSIDQWLLLVSIVAIIASPIIALWAGGMLSEKRETNQRKYAILRDLMMTRRARLDGAHVSALNLVELEFFKSDKVRSAYKKYVKNLSDVVPKDADARKVFLDEQDDLFAELLVAVAADLGFAFDKSDLSRLGYLPAANANHFDNQMINTILLREVLEGKRSIPFSNFVLDPKAFPPVPEQKQIEDKSEE